MFKARPRVTRWAPLVLDAIDAEGWDYSAVPRLVLAASILAVIHNESNGVNDLGPNHASAYGLVQHLLYYFPKQAAESPEVHLRLMVRLVRDLLDDTGGYLPTALFARGSGPAAAGVWVESGDCKRYKWVCSSKGIPEGGHLEYFHKLHIERIPAYSRWLTGWIEAGKPTEAQTIKQKARTAKAGKKEYTIPAYSRTVQMAVHNHGKEGYDLPIDYDGTHRWKGQSRLYKKATPTEGAGPTEETQGMSWWKIARLGAVAAVSALLFKRFI